MQQLNGVALRLTKTLTRVGGGFNNIAAHLQHLTGGLGNLKYLPGQAASGAIRMIGTALTGRAGRAVLGAGRNVLGNLNRTAGGLIVRGSAALNPANLIFGAVKTLNRAATAIASGAKVALQGTDRYAGKAGIAAGAGLAALTARGVGMNVSGARLRTETDMLGMELANVADPLVKAITQAVRSGRKELEKLDETGQNRYLAAAGLGAASFKGGGGLGQMIFKRAPVIAAIGGMANLLSQSIRLRQQDRGFNPAETKVDADEFGGMDFEKLRGNAPALEAKQKDLAGLEDRVKKVIKNTSPVDAIAGGVNDFFGMKLFDQNATSPRDVARVLENIHKQQKAIEGLKAEAAGGPKFQPEGPNPNRRRVPIADAGFEPVGSAYERIQTDLLMQGALDEGKKGGGDQGELVKQLEENTGAARRLYNKIAEMIDKNF